TTPTTHPYPLSLHDALPIYLKRAADTDVVGERQVAEHRAAVIDSVEGRPRWVIGRAQEDRQARDSGAGVRRVADVLFEVDGSVRSEEHTSELQSLRHLVCRL